MVAGQPRAASDFRPPPRTLGGAHAHLLRGGPTARPPKREPRLRSRFGRVRWRNPRCCRVRTSESSKVLQRTQRTRAIRRRFTPSASSTRTTGSRSTQHGQRCCFLPDSVRRRNGMLPSWLAWATIVLRATQLTPIGFLGSLLIPPWLIVVGIWLFRRTSRSTESVGIGDENVALANPKLGSRNLGLAPRTASMKRSASSRRTNISQSMVVINAPTEPRADARTRTADPFITSEVLYQLSYVGEPFL